MLSERECCDTDDALIVGPDIIGFRNTETDELYFSETTFLASLLRQTSLQHVLTHRKPKSRLGLSSRIFAT
jgi:hypothetical protein